MKILILYKTQKGSTKQYAQWLHEEFPGSDLENLDTFDASEISDYDLIVVGSPTIGGKIIGKDIVIDNWDKIKDKKVFFMSVGSIPQEKRWSVISFEKEIPEEIRNGLAGYVKLPGKMDKTGKIEKIMMRLIFGVKPKDVENLKELKKENLKPIIELLHAVKDK